MIVIIADGLIQGDILQQNDMYNTKTSILEFERFNTSIRKISVKILILKKSIEKF